MRKGRKTMPPESAAMGPEKSQSPLGNCAVAAGASCAPMLLAAGCARAPTLNILGSFFPAWIFCGVLGILLTVPVRLFFVRIKLEDELLWPLILVYPCLTAFFTFTLW